VHNNLPTSASAATYFLTKVLAPWLTHTYTNTHHIPASQGFGLDEVVECAAGIEALGSVALVAHSARTVDIQRAGLRCVLAALELFMVVYD
jgi:hypothetical protein